MFMVNNMDMVDFTRETGGDFVLLSLFGFYPFGDSGIPFADITRVIKEMQDQSNAGGEDGGTGLNAGDGTLLMSVLSTSIAVNTISPYLSLFACVMMNTVIA